MCGSAHTLVCNCLLISLLALVILIRVGGLPLQVMSVKSVSLSIFLDILLVVVVVVVYDLVYYCLLVCFFLQYAVNLQYVCLV